MKRKLKMIGILLTVIALTSIASVYAVQAVNSIDVSYDNTTSGLSSKNVKAAIDELYNNILSSKNLLAYLRMLADSETVIQNDGTEDKNMRYIGADPKNYVTFNGKLWRIIGVFNENTHGKPGELVKIEQASSNDAMKWYSDNTDNTWNNSLIKTYLNGEYHNNLSQDAKNMIQTVNWKVGGVTSDYAAELYEEERGSTGAYSTPSITTWEGDIALSYASDFLYATSGETGTTFSRDNCLSQDINTGNTSVASTYWRTDGDSAAACVTNSWLLQQARSDYANWWILDPYQTGMGIRDVHSNIGLKLGAIGGISPSVSYRYSPTLYLKPSVICKNCSDSTAGSSTNPFQLSYIEG